MIITWNRRPRKGGGCLAPALDPTSSVGSKSIVDRTDLLRRKVGRRKESSPASISQHKMHINSYDCRRLSWTAYRLPSWIWDTGERNKAWLILGMVKGTRPGGDQRPCPLVKVKADSESYFMTRGPWLPGLNHYYYYYFYPGTQFPGNEKNYAVQYKKPLLQKSSWNEPYSSSSFTKQKYYYYYNYYYAAFNAPCVGHKDDESQNHCLSSAPMLHQRPTRFWRGISVTIESDLFWQQLKGRANKRWTVTRFMGLIPKVGELFLKLWFN